MELGLTGLLFHKRERRELITKLFEHDRVNPTTSNLYKWILEHRQLSIVLLILIIVAKVMIAIVTYNDLVNLQQEVNNARADIESCLQMRENLVPQLVATVSDFVEHEDTVFFHSADVRANSINSGPLASESAEPGQRKVDTDNLQTSISKLFAVAERYPELKTSESFQILMSKAAEAEKEILDKRIIYNAKAYKINKKVTAFPDRIYAFLYGFKQAKYFQWNGEPEWVSRRVAE
jgi:LemA protein